MNEDYPITAESLDLMLSQTKITSEAVRMALHDHFVGGYLQSEAADRHNVARQQLNIHVVNIRTRIKPAFDAYATLFNLIPNK